MPSTIIIVSVAVPVPLYQCYDYTLDEQHAKLIHDKKEISATLVGRRVYVEFGHRKLVGVVIQVKTAPLEEAQELKAASLFDAEPAIINQNMLHLLKWAASYYCHPLGECLSTALPATIRKPKALPSLEARKWHRTDKAFDGPKNATRQKQILDFVASHADGIWEDALRLLDATPKQLASLEQKGYLEHQKHLNHSAAHTAALAVQKNKLNEEQQQVFEQLRSHKGFHTALLEGVTGSGKTEVYIHLVEDILRQDQQALILIPEINLSPQTFARFQSQLSEPIALIHSGLSEKEKYRAWQMASQGVVKVIIGTRSAVFTPFRKLGLIIIDEEHDNSYKQMDGFKYSARDLAIKRAQLNRCQVVLGSATPSLESLCRVEQGDYSWHTLRQRAGSGNLPAISLIDIRSRPLTDGLSPPLTQAIRSTLEQGDQVIVFQNRRGFAPALMCESCGSLTQCPNCDARITVHSHPPHLHCHHCDLKTALPKHCDNCGGTHFTALGSGTERIESSLTHQFPDADIIRIDRDRIKNQAAMNTAIEQIHSAKPMIIVGTQMLSKGHDFHNVTLVAVLDADGLFFSSDFRAIEKGAQQLTQIAGRTGRGDKAGRVLIQTRLPEHSLFEHVLNHDYRACAMQELEERKGAMLPPFIKMISIRAEANKLESTQLALSKLLEALQSEAADFSSTQVIGPIEASMTRKQGIYRSYLTLLSPNPKSRTNILLTLPSSLAKAKTKGVRFSVDVDPIEYM